MASKDTHPLPFGGAIQATFLQIDFIENISNLYKINLPKCHS